MMTLRRPPAYAGIGSRETPAPVLSQMRRIATVLARAGFVLRSGAAEGADTAFEEGAIAGVGQCEIYVPWRSFGDRANSMVFDDMPGSKEAMAIAANFHPGWASLKPAVRKLMARNVMQLLGRTCNAPSRFVLCWTPKWELDAAGRICNAAGGTGQAVRIAYDRGVAVFHLGISEHAERLERFCAEQEHRAKAGTT